MERVVNGQTLRQLRLALGISATDLAARAGVHVATVSRAERSAGIRPDLADRLLAAFELLADERAARRRVLARELLLTATAILIEDAETKQAGALLINSGEVL